jgi:FAD/FMN-containing dehydrogenase
MVAVNNAQAGADSSLDDRMVRDLRDRFQGSLLRPGDEGYDSARQVWNGMIDRKPALIAQCLDTSDVVSAVNFARTHNLLVAVRGGGHSLAGYSVVDGGLVIDLSRMTSVLVDPSNQTARAEGGAKWRDFDNATQQFGLATTGGTNSDTGIAGLTLGGGLGWLAGTYGLTCDNLLSAEVVTADGQVVTASSTENDDLYWGLRGGGGNFGVVTAFAYQLHPVRQVLGGMVVYPFEPAREVLQFYRAFTETAPDEVNTIAVMLTTPE